MLQYSTVDPTTLELLKKLMIFPALSDFNLVGGTALSLLLGHRKSIDLDLFGSPEFDADQLFMNLSKFGPTTLNFSSKNSLGLFINDVKVDIIRYDFPLINPVIISDTIRLLSIQDIAAMKLSAIAKRGSKKDFWDLFFLLKGYSLQQLLDFYEQKFGKESLFFVVKSLSFFDDADLEPDPIKLIDVNWSEIKSTIKTHLKNYI